MSAWDALLKHHQKQLPKENKKTRKNGKPEQITVRECMHWFNDHGFSMNIVESKAVYSASAGRYLRGQVAAGFLDSAGCTPLGIGCFVEFKAKGKRTTLRDAQREFIRDKVLKGCFSCVVDSQQNLENIYTQWINLDREGGIAYLLSILPSNKKRPTDGMNL